jgi:hypothetical protein
MPPPDERPNLLLYSTNVYLKFSIQREFRGDVHYVWCSEHFDHTALNRNHPDAYTARSSSPAGICDDLLSYQRAPDRHHDKINQQRATLESLAATWLVKTEITLSQYEEIIYLAKHADSREWRPLIYLIPRTLEPGRIKEVPPEQRASRGMEWKIEDLKGSEFDVIEVPYARR